ncbi:hypothetical protein WJX79_003202 [Trebouxia sp. C0005]
MPQADVSKMVMRSPFLLGLSSQTLAKRFHALQAAFPEGNVQRMIEYYPSLLECKVGKVIGNLKALQQLFPETVNTIAVVEYMPTLLLSNMQKVEEKYTRMQILCMHRPRWRKDLIASQQKPATFARLLGVSHRVIDRLSFLLEHQDLANLAASTILLMSRRPGDQAQTLVQPCRCPRPVHQTCLARWQLQSVGRSEETACRFCYEELPDWRTAYNLPTATPVMTVTRNRSRFCSQWLAIL